MCFKKKKVIILKAREWMSKKQDGTYSLIEQPAFVVKCILHSYRHQSKRLANVIISFLWTPIPFLLFFPYFYHLWMVHLKLQLHRVTQKGLLTISVNCRTVPQNHTKQCLSFISAKSQTDFKSSWRLCLFPRNIEIFCRHVMLFSNILVRYSDKYVLLFRWRNSARQNELSRFTKTRFQQCHCLSVLPCLLIYAFLSCEHMEERQQRFKQTSLSPLVFPALKVKITRSSCLIFSH